MRHNASLLDCVKVYNMIHTLQSMCNYLDENIADDRHALR
jgi:hypothetical protein